MGNMAFESTNPSGFNVKIDTDEEGGGENNGYRPKALMLSSLAGCTGLDVASLIKKMKLDVGDFSIDIVADLSDSHPQIYEKVVMEYHFYGDNLNEKKLQKAIDLSFEKYCGVSEMFKKFADVKIASFFHHRS